MNVCPKCHFAIEPQAMECPACGVVIAKHRSPPPPQDPPAAPVPAAMVPAVPDPAAPAARPNPYAPPPRPQPANPYAPPTALIEALEPPSPPGEAVTPPTVEALEATKPWIRLIVHSGACITILAFLAGARLFVANNLPPEAQSLSLFYFLYAGIGIALLLPMSRSAETLDWLQTHRPSICLEAYAKEQAELWRRTAIVYIAAFALLVVGVVWGWMENAF